VAAAIGLGAGYSAGAAEDLTILGLGIEKTITCDERPVVVNGAGHRLTLKGRCEDVAVHGTGNVVHVERLGRGQIDGLDNRLEWELAIRGERPVIRKGGVNVTVAQVAGGAPRREADDDGEDVTIESGGGRVTVGGGGGGVTIGSSSKPGDGSVRIRTGGTTARGSAPPAAVRVTESDIEKSYDCGGGSALVEGSDARLTLTGCRELTVTGGGNHVVLVGPVRSIKLLGGENEVQWSEGEGGRAPRVETPGADNRVVRR
jgi:hypothetical protein